MLDNEDISIPLPRCEEQVCRSFSEVEVKADHLNILYFNARSIVAKLDAITDLVISIKNIELLLIVETWLRYDISPSFNLPGYESLHVCRDEKKVGGISFFYRGFGYDKTVGL